LGLIVERGERVFMAEHNAAAMLDGGKLGMDIRSCCLGDLEPRLGLEALVAKHGEHIVERRQPTLSGQPHVGQARRRAGLAARPCSAPGHVWIFELKASMAPGLK
jgi:hypothetical protein